jgi:phytanoyl-CoA hydroxylase
MRILECPPFRLGETLTREQSQFFEKHGIIIFKNFLRSETVSVFISELDRIEKEWVAEGREKVNGIPLKFGKDEAGNKVIQRSCFLSLFSPAFQEFLEDPRLQTIIDLLHPYEGRINGVEKDGLVLNSYIRTAASQYSKMGWHTDSPRDIFLGQRIMPMLNVGIHLDTCSFDNGGLRVIPGTHKQSMFKLLFAKKYFVDNEPDPREVGFNIEAGDLTVHDGRIWHRVQQSPHFGEASRRRVMYVPVVTGKFKPKDENSKTPFYHRFLSKVNI